MRKCGAICTPLGLWIGGSGSPFGSGPDWAPEEGRAATAVAQLSPAHPLVSMRRRRQLEMARNSN